MKYAIWIFVMTMASLFWIPGSAEGHHGYAAFDTRAALTFVGTVSEFHDIRRGRDATFIELEQWHELLRSAGAESVLCLPHPGDVLARVGFHVFAVATPSHLELLPTTVEEGT